MTSCFEVEQPPHAPLKRLPWRFGRPLRNSSCLTIAAEQGPGQRSGEKVARAKGKGCRQGYKRFDVAADSRRQQDGDTAVFDLYVVSGDDADGALFDLDRRAVDDTHGRVL